MFTKFFFLMVYLGKARLVMACLPPCCRFSGFKQLWKSRSAIAITQCRPCCWRGCRDYSQGRVRSLVHAARTYLARLTHSPRMAARSPLALALVLALSSYHCFLSNTVVLPRRPYLNGHCSRCGDRGISSDSPGAPPPASDLLTKRRDLGSKASSSQVQLRTTDWYWGRWQRPLPISLHFFLLSSLLSDSG